MPARAKDVGELLNADPATLTPADVRGLQARLRLALRHVAAGEPAEHVCSFSFIRSEVRPVRDPDPDGFGEGMARLTYDVYACSGCPSYRFIKQPQIPNDFLGHKVFTLRPRSEVRNPNG